MGLTIRERRKIARTAATFDRVYPGRAARGGEAEARDYLRGEPRTTHEYMLIISATF
jgi:hypothetical protein